MQSIWGRVEPNMLSILFVFFLIGIGAFAIAPTAGEIYAYAYVGLSGVAGPWLVRAALREANGQIPVMINLIAALIMAGVIALIGLHYDQDDGQNLLVTLVTQSSGWLEMMAKHKAGELADTKDD